MSRSYRFNADGDERRPSWERPEGVAGLRDAWPEKEARHLPKRRRRKRGQTDFSGPATPEQAMERMRDRIDTVLSNLISRRIMPPFEKDDYAQILNIHICRMLPLYEPGRTGWKDREASLLRYLNVVVDSAVANIVKHCMTKKCNVNTKVPIRDESEEEDEEETESLAPVRNPYRDPRRYMEELWLRMDVEVMMEMMTPEERIALRMRLDGCTYPEIADGINARLKLGVDRFHVMNVTMEGVRRVARKCGFEEPRGSGKARDENSRK